MRVCSVIVTVTERYRAQITIRKGGQVVKADRMFDLLMLAAARGTELVLLARGTDAEEALEAVARVLDAGRQVAFAG